MKAFAATSGVLFGLLALAHIWRIAEEGPELLKQPVWVLTTVVSAALCFWAFLLLWRARRSNVG